VSANPRWFDRKFEFTVPQEQLPNIYVRLRGTPARLEEMLRDEASARLIARSGTQWSAQEHAGHLMDLETLWLARVRDFAAGAGELTAADLTNRKTDEANHNAVAVASILDGFRAGRGQLIAAVDALPPEAHARTIPHPRLRQPMRLIDHLYFVAEHDDHHLARIWALLHEERRNLRS
jgi:uncharacterized damage-inducible protein DinB